MLRKIFTCGILVALAVAFMLAATITPTACAAGNAKVLIGFKETPGRAEQALVRGLGGEIKYSYHIIPAIAATIPEEAVSALQACPLVDYVEEDNVYHVIQEDILPWGVGRIDAEVVWGGVEDATDVTSGANAGDEVRIGIVDTGIDKEHPDLIVVGGVHFYTITTGPPWERGTFQDDNCDDDHGHGTHVAGTIAALDNGLGVIGVAPKAFLYAVKVFNSQGSAYASDIVAGIEWCEDNGMQAVNMSFGGGDNTSIHDACDSAYVAGLVLVAAAGNDGTSDPTEDNVSYPAKYSSVIAVAATDSYDQRPQWSSTGPAIELAAPGKDILSTVPTADATYADPSGYAQWSGTSMACPHVVGTAALVINAGVVSDTDEAYGIANEVRDQLNSTAEFLTGLSANEQGNGLVDAEAACAPPGNRPPVADAGPDQSVKMGSTVQLDGSGSSDPDSDPLSYSWSFVSKPSDSAAALSNPNIVDPTFVADLDGTYEVELMVSDGELSDADTVVVTATTPTAPSNIMYVDSIVFSSRAFRNFNNLYTTVKVVDGDGNPLGGVRVEMTLTWDETNDETIDDSWNFAGNTNTDGTVKFTLLKAPSGYYTATVTNLILTDYTWDTTKGVTSVNCELQDDGTVIQGAAKAVASASPGNSLGQSCPNPANPEMEISYSIGQSGQVTLKVYNTLGQLVRTLVDDVKASGTYTVRWDGRDDSGALVASGVYFYRIVAGNYSQTKRMIMLR